METLIQASYFIVAVIFIVGLKQMSSPVTARRGILWAGAAMVLATIVTFLAPQIIDTDQVAETPISANRTWPHINHLNKNCAHTQRTYSRTHSSHENMG